MRVGNDAAEQFQLDIYGEVLDALDLARLSGIAPDENAWHVEQLLAEHVCDIWYEPDDGIWEMRGHRRHHTYSKMMAWLALERAIGATERYGLRGNVERWRTIRAKIHEDVCRNGFHEGVGAFVRDYGAARAERGELHLDASLLLMARWGFLPVQDPRVRGTFAAIERYLHDGRAVQRYLSESKVDGLPVGEGAFIPCSFWMVDALHSLGRVANARELFEQVLALCNDVGLLSEEWDPRSGRLLGNFPQAYSHVALVNSACLLAS